MATQWREKAVEDLAGKYELTALGIGVGVFLDPRLLLQ